jgi:hypothetical protein
MNGVWLALVGGACWLVYWLVIRDADRYVAELLAEEVSATRDRAWARRSNTDTGLIRPYLTEARDQKNATSDDAKTRQAVELLLAAWQPVDGSPLRWSLEWLARNTDRNTNA